MADYDLTIIGGGINGTAIARDAAGRGLRVLLAEMNDLGSGTSWASSKLIHGGLRYLEQGAFKLVREGLHERALLLRMAPHIIWPSRFILPHHTALRPMWQLRIGMFLYDLLAGKSVFPKSHSVNLAGTTIGSALQSRYTHALEYSDCRVDDVRLVVLNALDAMERGATILTRTAFKKATRLNGEWHIELTSQNVTSRALINASGPWIEEVNGFMPREIARSNVKLIQGSHIVVPRLFDHDKSYIFQNADGRIVFAIPYEHEFTLIGTTDLTYSGDPAKVHATEEEISYLCNLANEYFKTPIAPKDVVWSFAGIRALYDNRTLNAKNLSRDFLLELDTAKDSPPLLSIYGGKLTAARHLAELALDKLTPHLPMSAAWTQNSTLPGGDFEWNDLQKRIDNACKEWPFLSVATITRMVRAYGTRIAKVLGDAKSIADLGTCFGADVWEREINYLMKNEWAHTVDDVIWRRSKLGLHLTKPEQEKLARFMESKK